MSRRSRIIVGTLGALVVFLAALAVFMQYQIRKSFPQTEGVIPVAGLSAPVEVFRDSYGVPEITAASEHDLLVALGYVQAQDRLWQMDMGRRIAMGRLSEVIGEVTVPFDRMFRIVGVRRAAEQIEPLIPDAERERLEWYADGVNAYIRGHRGKLPVEFDLLGYDPEPWQPLHSLMIGKLMAWELNLSWWTDLTYGALVAKLGQEAVAEILPGYPADVPPAVPQEVWKGYAALRESYLATAQQYAALTGRVSMLGGSNAWAVGPGKAAHGGAILANDTHLQLQSPARWYEAELRSPGFHVRGMGIVGVPAVIAGRNDSIAWGMTNLMADDADFYIERVDSTDSSSVQFAGVWEPFTTMREEIPVKGGRSVPLTIRLTRHGPVVTDIRTMLQKADRPFVASMRWTGTDPDDQLEAFNLLNRAASWTQFTAALSHFPGPGQNFVYADRAGNIGFYSAAKIPVRGGRSGLLPQPGWEPDAEWKGFVPFAQMPHLFNPPEGFVASANNKAVDDAYPYRISDLWEPPSRIRRLRELLGADSSGAFTAEDFQRFQTDAFSANAREVLPVVLAAFRDSALGLPEEERVFEYLRNWNFRFTREDVATTIYQTFYVHLLRNIYADEMGEGLFHDWLVLVNVPIRVTTRLLQDGTSRWFDDVRTEAVETRDAVIRKSLREAVVELEKERGLDMKVWRWGNLHTVTLQHPFGLQKPLDRIFNVGPFPASGASTALVSNEYSFNEPFHVTVGPSFRQIFDLGSGEIRSVLPTGQSGQVFHPHYADQAELWLNGINRVNRWDARPAAGQVLRLEPPRGQH